MYSRFPRNSERPVRLPEHYSGCAFSDPRETEPPPPPPVIPSPPQVHENPPKELTSPQRELSSLFSRPLALFSEGLRFEELLLIGLIILLSKTEQDNDVILWLALLLFCK